MSGLYNVVLGRHPFAGQLLVFLGFKDEAEIQRIPRLRDVYIYPDEIRILTRTGGGNRDEYAVENDWLRNRDGFLRDWDDEYDSTYAWWAYKWPAEFEQHCRAAVETLNKERPDLMPEHLGPRFEAAIEEMKEGAKRIQRERERDTTRD